MRFYLINEKVNKEIDIPNDYKEINKALNFNDAWNTPTIRINGLPYIAICSDMGKLRHLPVSALSFNNLIHPKNSLIEPFLVGSLIITKFDGVDDYESLSDYDIKNIESCIMSIGKESNEFYKNVLVID